MFVSPHSHFCLATGSVKDPDILQRIVQLFCGAIDTMTAAIEAWGIQPCDGRDLAALVTLTTKLPQYTTLPLPV